MTVSSSNAVENIALKASFSKIYKPDLASPQSCTTGSIAIWREDGEPFQSGEQLDVSLYAYYPEDRKRSSIWVTKAFPEIGYDLFSRTADTKIGAKYRLCADAWQKSSFRPNFSALFLEIIYSMNYGSTQAGRYTAIIPILPKDNEAVAIEKVEKSCPFSNFEDNAVPVVSPATVGRGKMVTISGTYFIKGVPVPNQPIAIYKEVFTQVGDRKVTELGKDVTNKEGAFEFRFKFSPEKGDPMPFLTIARPIRTEQIGFLHGPFDSTFSSISFICEKGKCKYMPGGTYTDFIPEFPEQCLAAFKEYDDVFGVGAGLGTGVGINFADDRNLIAWLGRKVFRGSKNKVSFTAEWISKDSDFTQRDARNIGKSGGSSGSTGIKGRCYVRGYTTKTGKRVSGYYRSC
jgi:hypothetical protein